MSVVLPSLHIGLKSNETESKPFLLPRESGGDGYCIRTIVVVESSEGPNVIVLEREQPDNIKSNEIRWEEIGIGKRSKQQYATYLYSWTGKVIDDYHNLPKVRSSENRYRIRTDSCGIILYFAPFAFDQELRSSKPVRALMDGMCIMQEFLEKCVTDNEELKLRIDTLERVYKE